jgi:RND family efflux transporter MFP subunit
MKCQSRITATLPCAVVVAVALTGCRERNEFVAPPPPKVTVARPLQQMVVTFVEFPGRAEPYESVEVRARVRGFLEEIHFEEGAKVEAGDLLYTIEQDPYVTALDAAKAQLANTLPKIDETEFDYKKTEGLIQQGVATDQEFVMAKAAYDAAVATKMAAEAAVAAAELDLSYTEVKAPISGRVNRTLVDVGNLVGQGLPTALTSIVRWDPIHVYFTASEREVLAFRRRQAGGESQRVPENIPVYVRLADGTDYPIAGRFDYIDNRVDPDTGTIRIRAVFDNSNELLVPGIFARARIPSEPKQAVLVPEVALQRDLAGYFLLSVDNRSTVNRIDVEVAELVDRMRVILAGLTGEERIIISGLQRARPGIEVDAEETALEKVALPTDVTAAPAPQSTPTTTDNEE